jgi:hypothetical protein
MRTSTCADEIKAAVLIYDAIVREIPWRAHLLASTYPEAAALALERAKQNGFAVGSPSYTLRLRRVSLTSCGTTMGKLAEFCARIVLVLAVAVHSVQIILAAFAFQGSDVSGCLGHKLVGHITGEEIFLVLASSIDSYIQNSFSQALIVAVATHEQNKCVAFGMSIVGILLGAVFTWVILKLSNMLGYISGAVIGGVLNLVLVTKRGITIQVDEQRDWEPQHVNLG